jgi:hypothetical protein
MVVIMHDVKIGMVDEVINEHEIGKIEYDYELETVLKLIIVETD